MTTRWFPFYWPTIKRRFVQGVMLWFFIHHYSRELSLALVIALTLLWDDLKKEKR